MFDVNGRSLGDPYSRYRSIDQVRTKDFVYITTQKGIGCIDRVAYLKADKAESLLDKESKALSKSIKEIRNKHKAAAKNPEELNKLTAELTKATNRLTAIAKEKNVLNVMHNTIHSYMVSSKLFHLSP